MVDSELLETDYAIYGKMWIYHECVNVLGRLDIRETWSPWISSSPGTKNQQNRSKSVHNGL